MKQFFILLLTIATLLLGCDKSFEKFEPNNNGFSDSVWANNPSNNLPINDLYEDLELDPLIDSVPDNITVAFPPYSFLMNGTPFTNGKVNVKFQLVSKKGDMVRMCLPTQSNGYLLESGGEIYLDASKNGMPLSLAAGKQITVNYRSAAQPSSLMKGFIGTAATTITGSNSCFNWVPVSDNGVMVSTTSNGYLITTNHLNWINCDYFNDTANTKTTVAVTLPLGFTNANTYTFIVFKNSNGIMQFDADAVNKLWVKNKVPINKPVVYISISKRGDDFYFATSETYTMPNQHIVLKPYKQKLQEIIGYLETL